MSNGDLTLTPNFCFYLQNRLIQTSQTGGQRYSDTYPFSITCLDGRVKARKRYKHIFSIKTSYFKIRHRMFEQI